jgi:peptidyl-tRNA hydrolase
MGNIKQYIVLRKNVKTKTGDPVSASKLAVMTSHASMSFLTKMIMDNEKDNSVAFVLNSDLKEWICDIYTKILLEAKNLNAMNKTVKRAEEAGLIEGQDFFLIKDNCLTELVPDEGSDRCFIAIGFRPMDAEKIKPVVKKLQLYK